MRRIHNFYLRKAERQQEQLESSAFWLVYQLFPCPIQCFTMPADMKVGAPYLNLVRYLSIYIYCLYGFVSEAEIALFCLK